MEVFTDSRMRGPDFAGTGTVNDAAVTSQGELITSTTEREKNVISQLVAYTVSTNTAYLLIDLSDNGGLAGSGFHHNSTGRVDISCVRSFIDKSNTAAGVLKMGVVTSISSTSSNITYFHTLPFFNAGVNHIEATDNFAPSQIKCGVSGSVTTHIASNDKDVGNTLVNSVTTLTCSSGTNTAPAVGDVVGVLTITAGTVSLATTLTYHSEASSTLNT